MRNWLLLVSVPVVVLAGAVPLAAQQAAAPLPTLGTVRTHRVSVWTYPRGDRRDPVLPPDALYSGEGLPDLRLHSIAYDPQDERGSRALVVVTGRGGRRAVVRSGDAVGGYRIVSISRSCVTTLQNVLGTNRRAVVCLARPGEDVRP